MSGCTTVERMGRSRGRTWLVGLVALLVVAAAGCAGLDEEEDPALTVAVTIFPVASWAEEVVGDRAEVVTLVPAGADPHHWEPSPDAIVNIEAADAFIYVDPDYEFWLGDRLGEWEGQEDGPALLALLDQVDPLPAGDDHHHDHEHEDHDDDHHNGDHHDEPHDEDHHNDEHHEGQDHAHDDHDHADGHDDDHHHDHGEEDPHFWTDPVRAAVATARIAEFLSQIDPDGAEIYEANAVAFIEALEALDADFREALGACEHDVFITAHAAFAYLADTYGLETVPILGVHPEIEPSPRDLERIIQLAEERGLSHVFMETGVSPEVSETVADEVGAEVLLLHPLEAVTEDDLDAGATYLSLMEQNLASLAIALQCPE